jgi:stage IV sporulation protein B
MKEEQTKRPWLMLLSAVLVLVMALSNWNAAPGGQKAACLGKTETRYLVPVGRTVGIKLFARGVMVVGLSDVNAADGTCSPAKECGLKSGDIITCINQTPVNSIEEVEAALSQCGGTAEIQATRGRKELTLTATEIPCMADGSYKLGAWIRDSMAGIGTVTFYDPETHTFAALGHGINDVDTGLLMPLQSGAVMPSKVSGILPGEKGCPGELHGSFDLNRDVGTLSANTDWGIFGTGEPDYFGGEAMEVAHAGELKTGLATILANVEGDTVAEYQVEILRVYPSGGNERQSLMLRVTDPRLLEKTGGIVQGMSGSPILQNGKLVGAVTHVYVR